MTDYERKVRELAEKQREYEQSVEAQRNGKIKTYRIYEICGKHWGECIECKAENAIEAMRKAGMTSWIRPYEKFKEPYFGPIYEIKLIGDTCAEYVCHQ